MKTPLLCLVAVLGFSSGVGCQRAVKMEEGGNARCYYDETLIFNGQITLVGEGEVNFSETLTGIHRLCSDSAVWCQIDFSPKGDAK